MPVARCCAAAAVLQASGKVGMAARCLRTPVSRERSGQGGRWCLQRRCGRASRANLWEAGEGPVKWLARALFGRRRGRSAARTVGATKTAGDCGDDAVTAPSAQCTGEAGTLPVLAMPAALLPTSAARPYTGLHAYQSGHVPTLFCCKPLHRLPPQREATSERSTAGIPPASPRAAGARLTLPEPVSLRVASKPTTRPATCTNAAVLLPASSFGRHLHICKHGECPAVKCCRLWHRKPWPGRT